MTTEVDDIMKKILLNKGVIGIIVLNADGVPIKSNMESNITIQYAALVTHLCDKAKSAVRDLDSTNELTFLRLRSKKYEILVAPDKNYLLIVVQVQDLPKVKGEGEEEKEEE